jgi:hypothetical protein
MKRRGSDVVLQTDFTAETRRHWDNGFLFCVHADDIVPQDRNELLSAMTSIPKVTT